MREIDPQEASGHSISGNGENVTISPPSSHQPEPELSPTTTTPPTLTPTTSSSATTSTIMSTNHLQDTSHHSDHRKSSRPKSGEILPPVVSVPCHSQPLTSLPQDTKQQQQQQRDTLPAKTGASDTCRYDSDNDTDVRPYVYKSCNAIVRSHGYGNWVSFIVRRFLRVLFTQSLPLYLPVHCIPIVLFKRHLLLERPKEVLLSLVKANAKSCMFLASFQTLFIAVVCMGNRLLKNDSPYTAVVSGFLAPLSILFENPNRRKEMMLYCIPRVTEIVERYGIESNWFTDLSNATVALFSLSMGVLMYFYHLDGNGRSIKPSIRSLLSLILGY